MGDFDADIDALLSRRHDNGADFWASPEGKIYVGNPFSTLSCLGMLHELGVASDHEAVRGGLDLILAACREDGRIRLGPKAPMYPCYTSEAARMLCRFGETGDELRRTVDYLLGDTYENGGWRCSFSRFGRGPETEFASPGATLYTLDVLRFLPEYRSGSEEADRAVEAVLHHWEVRDPIGPCHHGIGSKFLQVEYPFIRYNLFYYVYVLSFFARALEDARFGEALELLAGKLDDDGAVVVESPHRGLGKLSFCAKGRPSGPATARFREIEANVGGL